MPPSSVAPKVGHGRALSASPLDSTVHPSSTMALIMITSTMTSWPPGSTPNPPRMQIHAILATSPPGRCLTTSTPQAGPVSQMKTQRCGEIESLSQGYTPLASELKTLQQGARDWGPGLLSPELCLQTVVLLHNSLKVECQQKGRRDDGDKALHLAATGHNPCESQCCVSHHCGRKFQFWLESSLYPLLPPMPPRATRILGLVLCG